MGAAGVLAGGPGRARGRAGRAERGGQGALDGIAFVAQDTPLYKNLPAADMLHLTRNLNRRFDQAYAETRLAELGIPLNRKARRLSGGQQAQLALTLALARRPRLLILDEPAARLDPGDPVPPGWEAHPVGLEELALAYLREPGAGALPGPARSRALPRETGHPSEVTR